MPPIVAVLTALAASGAFSPVEPTAGVKAAFPNFHGVHILTKGVGSTQCGGSGFHLGPFAESAVIFIDVNAVEQNGGSEDKRGIRITVSADRHSIIDTVGTPQSVRPRMTTSITSEDQYFLPKGAAVTLHPDVCPTGDIAAERNISAYFHLVAIAAPDD